MSTQTRSGLALACLLLPCLARAAPLYSLTPIEAVNPYDSVHPTTINARGQVAGAIAREAPDGSHTYHPFFWGGAGPARELVAPGGTGEYAYGYVMNNRGEVLARVGNQNFIWSPDGGARAVAPPRGYAWAAGARGLNDAGTIVSYGQKLDGGGLSGFRQHADGSVEELAFGGVALNQAGAALGWWNQEPAVWERDGTVRPLSTAGYEYASVEDINDAGWVVGKVFVADANSLAVWRPDGTLTIPVAGVSENNSWEGYGINNRGEVVGYGRHSLFWSETDGLVDLQTRLDGSGAGWELGAAMDINDAGQIVATAFRVGDRSYRPYGVLLTPVPEPSLAPGTLLSLAALARRRRRSLTATPDSPTLDGGTSQWGIQ